MRHPFLSADEERGLIIQAQAGDLNARDRVIEGIMPLIHKQANYHANRNHGIDPEDLVQEAVQQIIRKFNFFNPNRGLRFITYFDRVVRNVMVRFAAQNGIVKSVGNRDSQNPRTQAARIKHAGPVRSLNVPADEIGNDVIDLLEDKREETPASEARRLALIEDVRACLERVPERWREIMRWKYIDDLTNAQIGENVHLSRERVRQIARQGMRWVQRILLTSPMVREYVEEEVDARTAVDSQGPLAGKRKRFSA